LEKYVKEIQKHLKYIGRNEFEYDINVSLKNRFIYVETPKVGCSTIKDILQRIELGYPELEREDLLDIHDRNYSPLLTPSQTCGLDRLINNPDYFVFCFVRNPYTRLLSVYLDKISRGFPQKKIILKALGKNPDSLSTEVTFRDFVNIVCDQDVPEMDPHWRVQYYQTFQDTITYDFVGKLESFSKDLEFVLGRITKDFGKYMRSELRHATNSGKLVKNFYTNDIKNKVYKKYKIDFEYFNYNKDS
jgi:hypothetical protein